MLKFFSLLEMARGRSAQISKNAANAIQQSRKTTEGTAISCITLFELAHLIGRGRIATILSRDAYLQDIESRFVVLPLTRQIAACTVQLPSTYPNDPMDRIIGATAIVEGLALVTADPEMRCVENYLVASPRRQNVARIRMSGVGRPMCTAMASRRVQKYLLFLHPSGCVPDSVM